MHEFALHALPARDDVDKSSRASRISDIIEALISLSDPSVPFIFTAPDEVQELSTADLHMVSRNNPDPGSKTQKKLMVEAWRQQMFQAGTPEIPEDYEASIFVVGPEESPNPLLQNLINRYK